MSENQTDFSFYSLVSAAVRFGGGWKLCVAVDGDARQVISDDLVDCKKRGERQAVSFTHFLMGLRCNKAAMQKTTAESMTKE